MDFKSIEEALTAVMAVSSSLGHSDLGRIRRYYLSTASLKRAVERYYKEKRRYCDPTPLIRVEEWEGGGELYYVTCSNTNEVLLQVADDWLVCTCTYKVHTNRTADDSSAVAAFMESGWWPDEATKTAIRHGDQASEEEAEVWPLELFGRKYLPKRERRRRKGAGRFHVSRT